MMRVPHPADSPDLSLCDFSSFRYTKEQLKDQIITSEDDLEGKLTEVWEIVSGDLFKLVFHGWVSRLECVMGQEG
jgi:hypothetical protein